MIYFMNAKKMILKTNENYYDTTHFHVLLTILPAISELQATSTTKAFNWFVNNHMKANPVQCDLLTT